MAYDGNKFREDMVNGLTILSLILEIGTSAALKSLINMDKEDPTVEDIQALRRHIERKPEEFFGNKKEA